MIKKSDEELVNNNNLSVANKDIMSITKFYIGDRVKLVDNDKISEKEKSLDFVVVQVFKDGKYMVANGDFKHKVSADEIVKSSK